MTMEWDFKTNKNVEIEQIYLTKEEECNYYLVMTKKSNEYKCGIDRLSIPH